TRPASAARPSPVPIELATSPTETGPGYSRFEPSGKVIWTIKNFLKKQKRGTGRVTGMLALLADRQNSTRRQSWVPCRSSRKVCAHGSINMSGNDRHSVTPAAQFLRTEHGKSAEGAAISPKGVAKKPGPPLPGWAVLPAQGLPPPVHAHSAASPPMTFPHSL